MKYGLFFQPVRPETDDGSVADAVLLPTIVSEDGRIIASNKVVTTVEKALSFYAGFEIGQIIGEVGFDGVAETLEEDEGDELRS